MAPGERALLSGPYPPGLSRRVPLEGVPPLVPAFVHRPVLLAGPDPSGSAEPSRRCQGCSRPARCLPGQAALSFSDLLRQAEGGSFHPTRLYGASWRTGAYPQIFKKAGPHSASHQYMYQWSGTDDIRRQVKWGGPDGGRRGSRR